MGLSITINNTLQRGFPGGETYIPQYLIDVPPTVYETFESTTGWTHNGTSLTVNTTEKYAGSASLKLTSVAAGTSAQLDKVVNWNFSQSDFDKIKLFVYFHTSLDPSIVSQFNVFLAPDGTFTNYFVQLHDPSELKQGGWVELASKGWTKVGNPDPSDIKYIRIRAVKATGEVVSFSVDNLTFGGTLRKAVIITFDDGNKSEYTLAYPILQAKKMKASAYIVSSYRGANNLTDEQIIFLNNAGWNCCNHTNSHPLTPITQAAYLSEWETCDSFLSGLGLARGNKHCAYSGSSYDSNALAATIEFGAKTGKGGTLLVTTHKVVRWPYTIGAYSPQNINTPAEIQTYCENTIARGGTPVLTFHALVSASPTTYQYLVSDFQMVIDYLYNNNYQSLTMDEYYRLNSGAIVVNHK